MNMVAPSTYKNDETEELCREIAKKSNGVCLLAFSGGKDSLAIWIYLLNFFKRIIPFHCASYPCLKSRERLLQYYESAFDTHIIRMVGEEVSMSLANMIYQTPGDSTELADLDTPAWSKLQVFELLRKELNLPKAWCAVGISVGDSIDRRIYCKKVGGKNQSNRTFYPLFSAERADILSIVRNSGLKLDECYRWVNRSPGGVPGYTMLQLFREHYAEDYNSILNLWPLAEAKTYREMMLDAIWERRKAEGVVDDENESEGAFDDGSDIMPEIGMNENGETEDDAAAEG